MTRYIYKGFYLQLHCTILNASNRKPRIGQPFCYSDILESDALRVLRENAGDPGSRSEGSSTNLDSEHNLEKVIDQEGDFSGSIQRNPSMSALPQNIPSSSNPNSESVVKNPSPVPVNLGVFIVEEIQLWIMGSHGPNNEYINCGGVVLE